MPRDTSGLRRGGGRTKGVPNKVTAEVRDLARKLVDDTAYLGRLKTRLQGGRCAPAVETMLWHYAYGKPKETIEHQGPDGGTPPVALIPTHLLEQIEHAIADAGDADA